MKTIYTSLPIYDRLDKQCYERIKKSKLDKLVPIVCPRHKLPAFQWLDDGSVHGAVSKIELIDTLGETYNVPCNFTGWTNTGYNTFTASGLEITSAINNDMAGARCATVGYFYGRTGEILRLHGDFILNSGTGPVVEIYQSGGLEYTSPNLATGEINTTWTFAGDGVVEVHIACNVWDASFSFTNVEITIDSINAFFTDLPGATVLTTGTYYTHEGGDLEYLLPAGNYYLKITTANAYVLYSEWFKVDCVYENLITVWTNVSYEVHTSVNTKITLCTNSAASGYNTSSSFNVIKGEKINVVFYLTKVSGTLPVMVLANSGWSLSDTETVVEGFNSLEFTATWDGVSYLHFYNNATNGSFRVSEVFVFREYSEKYLTINYFNSCDLGDLLYSEGMTQTIWFESETMEPSFPQEEEGVKNGDARFVRSFARQVKKYIARTKDMPDYMVEVFNRMKLHDSVEMIDLVGNVNDIYNLEVEHEWLWDDKYLAKIDLTFDYDEAFVIGGCCNNLT